MTVADPYPPSSPPTRRRRLLAEGAIFVVAGLLMGVLEPYGSGAAPPVLRYLYWLTCIVGGGLAGIAVDLRLQRSALSLWPRVVATALVTTLPVSLIVYACDRLMFDQVPDIGWLTLPLQVFAILLPVMAVHALIWRRPDPVVETRTVIETQTVVETRTLVEPPLPTATETFRRRLSARRRSARLIAVEAHDHYLRIHTDAGEELIAGRLSDTLGELAQAHGYHVHRSWWIAADAIEKVRWDRGAGEACLVGGLTVPVSRRRAEILKLAGW